MASPVAPRRRLRFIAAILAATLLMLGAPAPAHAAGGAFVGSAILPGNDGYWLVSAEGAVSASGNAVQYGDMGGTRLNAPIVAMASTSSGHGYWLLARDGGIFTFGDAAFFGSTGSLVLNQPVVGMAATPTGHGYWLVARDGGIFTFGDAAFLGSTGSLVLNQPVVGMAAAADGQGYWMVASDGGIFAFGSAAFFGSAGSLRLSSPVVAMSTTPSGQGYWLAGADGGIFTFGDAAFRGSSANTGSAKAIAVLRDATGGYALVRADGTLDSRPASRTNTGPVADPEPADVQTDSVATALGWQLREQENFSGTTIGPKWPTYNGIGTGGIGTRSSSAVSVGNGALNITGRGSVTGGTCWCYAGGGQTYGKWEVRARMDNGKGHVPAMLLWPESERWPIDGEIDIAEFASPVRNESSFTVHYGTDNRQLQYSSAGDFTQWHIFGVDWQPTYIKYYLDGVLKYKITNPEAIPHTPMHLALQVDSGDGFWSPSPDANSVSTLQVDWARIYKP